MKNEDKKVPDAPKRLWVRTNSLIHDTGLTAVGNISYRDYWIGHKNKVPDIKPYCYEEEEEYISLSRSWHKAKEVPEDLHTNIIGVSKDFTHPVLIDLEKKKYKALFLDIMLNNRFVCTLKYMYCPLFAIRYEELLRFVLNKRPSLKGKPFRIMF